MDFLLADLPKSVPNSLQFGPNVKARSAISNTLSGDFHNFTGVLEKDILFQIVYIVDVCTSKAERDRTANRDVNNVTVDTVRASKMIQSRENRDQKGEIVDTGFKVFKLTLEDSRGNLVYGFEIEPLGFLRQPIRHHGVDPLNGLPRGPIQRSPIRLGSKLIVHKNTRSSLGLLMLSTRNVTFLGGSVDELND
ncbi:unnamed protein product [Kuraishia capsulata CBS 1993]|uniref:RecQ mediated genome instability protein 1 OB-fold domain-containing protein n=1 Tax=Kuraishia capsulata CBS 1993 TaxID=1382522 RepID=W6MM33_9ASCO|nr:uncharacterized protein KUCA_T00003544001 [Kuraishia capsulata CBS 1993]CDK27566.1 unnamed protein product [Kuraishia capsulata CBS 1993]